MNIHSNRTLRLLGLLALFALVPVLADAHPFHGRSGLVGGLTHPLMGLDHLLAMVAVGLWAVQLGGRALWVVPTTFVTLMAVGGVLGMSGVPLPMSGTGVLLSVMVLGVLISAAARLPLAVGAALVGLFAVFHGHAHGAEMPVGGSASGFALGFILATAMLHACGIALGLLARKQAAAPAIRFAGAAILLAGLILWVG
jgi:urease accessory protein